jgi:stearoyl-CoA desaturase (delta-9 desaturase)
MFGIIGNGVAGHRYFAHRSFQTNRVVHYFLSYATVMAAFAPPSYWVMQHSHHHRNSDNDEDIHTPAKGLWKSWYGWLFDKNYVEFILQNKKAVVSAIIKNRLKFFELNYYKIIYISLIIIFIIDYRMAFMYFVAYAWEVFRLGAVNSMCHKWGYRNHETADKSRNNIIVGLLGMGFGWHNNHHADPRKLILTEKWWELDIEGIIGYILSKK